MGNPETVNDLWPIIAKLPRSERLRLGKLALGSAAANDDDQAAYASAPPSTDEFSSVDDPLDWDAGGWEEFDASR